MAFRGMLVFYFSSLVGSPDIGWVCCVVLNCNYIVGLVLYATYGECMGLFLSCFAHLLYNDYCSWVACSVFVRAGIGFHRVTDYYYFSPTLVYLSWHFLMLMFAELMCCTVRTSTVLYGTQLTRGAVNGDTCRPVPYESHFAMPVESITRPANTVLVLVLSLGKKCSGNYEPSD